MPTIKKIGGYEVKNSSSSGGGVGFTGLLTIVFIVLKLVGAIDWSWWWVLSPVWISAILYLIFLVVLIMGLWHNQ